MSSNGDGVRESKLGAWREQIRRWADASDKLDVICKRLDEADLSETERDLLRVVAKSDTGSTYLPRQYRRSLGEEYG